MPRILAIETSCDETAAALVEDGMTILSSIVASQVDMHGKYGGVVPELASREHLRAIVPVVRQAMADAGMNWGQLDAIAVTEGPGLVGSLLVGITYAKALSAVHKLPLIGTNHLEGHIHAVLLEARAGGSHIELPALALVASGGHTHLFLVSTDLKYQLLGRTRDDAAGEAYDKIAKLLGFGYPGGPVLDRLAVYGDSGAIPMPLAKMKGNSLDFSFSGLKTAMLRWVESREMQTEIAERQKLLKRNGRPRIEEWLAVTPQSTLDAIAAFQSVVIEEILKRIHKALDEYDARAVIISGGVACNAGLRHAAAGERLSVPIFFPTPGLSTDNAAMIAAAAFPKFERAEFSTLALAACANLKLA